MSCFRIPKNICDDINKICAGFWWGSTLEKKKKAHWLGWNKICVSKELGGMGSRDLVLFNKAILAKLN